MDWLSSLNSRLAHTVRERANGPVKVASLGRLAESVMYVTVFRQSPSSSFLSNGAVADAGSSKVAGIANCNLHELGSPVCNG